MNASSAASGETSHRERGPRALLRSWTRGFLRVPLVAKLYIANLAITAVAGAAVLSAAAWLEGGLATDVVAPVATLGLFVVVAGAALNAILIRLALSPLERLEKTAEAVRRGALATRAERSPLADRPLESLTRTFNDMLDSVEAARARELELATRVLDAEERQRSLLARELYGGASQTLAGVLVRLQVAARRADPDPGMLEEIRNELVRGLEEIRAVARRLRPPELDELGVLPALEGHARRLRELAGVQVEFHGHLPESSLERPARLALFRIVQEALSNAFQHAHANRIDVTFHPASEGLRTTVWDDGGGFDVDEALEAPDGSLGLLAMRERAGYVGGSLRFNSAPGSGTTVEVLLPWSAASKQVPVEPSFAEERLRAMVP